MKVKLEVSYPDIIRCQDGCLKHFLFLCEWMCWESYEKGRA
jgi:hypothetical protein